MQHSKLYIIGFSAAVCLVCSIIVSGAAVSLKPLQEANKLLDRKSKVPTVAGLLEEGEKANAATIDALFAENVVPRVVDLSKATYVELSKEEFSAFDQKKRASDPELGIVAPKNAAGIQRISKQAMIYHVKKEGKVEKVILPVKGKGLWSTLYGFVALKTDIKTIAGLTFYAHAETPGLGGEVDNPRWKGLWPGKKIYDENGAVTLEVIKGSVVPGTSQTDYQVDGLSGATLTSRGVSNILEYWLGNQAFGPVLKELAVRT